MKHCFAILALIALGSPIPSQAYETTDDQTWVTQAMAQTQAIGNRTEFELGSDSNGPGTNVPVARQKLHTLHMAQALAHRLKRNWPLTAQRQRHERPLPALRHGQGP